MKKKKNRTVCLGISAYVFGPQTFFLVFFSSDCLPCVRLSLPSTRYYSVRKFEKSKPTFFCLSGMSRDLGASKMKLLFEKLDAHDTNVMRSFHWIFLVSNPTEMLHTPRLSQSWRVRFSSFLFLGGVRNIQSTLCVIITIHLPGGF